MYLQASLVDLGLWNLNAQIWEGSEVLVVPGDGRASDTVAMSPVIYNRRGTKGRSNIILM